MALDDTYDYEAKVTEAALLTEVELAALLLPREQPLGEEEGVYNAARAKVQKMLDLSVYTRENRACSQPGCHTKAIYLIQGGGDPLQSCQPHLDDLIAGDCTVTLIDPASVGGEAE